jgi:hypothetical protein
MYSTEQLLKLIAFCKREELQVYPEVVKASASLGNGQLDAAMVGLAKVVSNFRDDSAVVDMIKRHYVLSFQAHIRDSIEDKGYALLLNATDAGEVSSCYTVGLARSRPEIQITFSRPVTLAEAQAFLLTLTQSTPTDEKLKDPDGISIYVEHSEVFVGAPPGFSMIHADAYWNGSNYPVWAVKAAPFDSAP